MTAPLDVTCPSCWAKPGERCDGGNGATHDARVAHAKNRERELRSYDVEPAPVPAEHEHDQPPGPPTLDGHVAHVFSDHTRNVGLAGVAHAKAILAERRTR